MGIAHGWSRGLNRGRNNARIAFAAVLSIVAIAVALAAPAAWAQGGDYAAAPVEAASDGDSAQPQLDQQAAKKPRTAESFGKLGSAKVPSRVQAVEFSGATAQATAAAQAKAAFPNGSKSAIIVGAGNAWVDGVSAVGLAKSKGPILYSGTNSLGAPTRAALKTLGVKSVLIIGDAGIVGKKAVAQLKRAGIKVEARLAGDTYCDTQLAVFKYGAKKGLWSKKRLFVVGGYSLDALSILPVACAKSAPVFVTADGGNLTKAQRVFWKKWAKKRGGKQVVAVGGTSQVSKQTAAFVRKAEKLAGGNGKLKRIAKPSVYKTALAVAKWAVGSQGFTWDRVAFTTGESASDALAGSVAQGMAKSVMLPADSMGNVTVKAMKKCRRAVSRVRFFGDTDAVPWITRMTIADALKFPVAALPGFKLYLDAGHGPNNDGDGKYGPGAVANGYEEHDLTVELTRKMAKILRKTYGVKLFLNDDGDPYYERHAEAVAKGCCEIISIHFNAYGGGDTTGSLTLIHSYNASPYSKTLQDKLHPYLLKAVGLADEGKRPQQVAILGGPLPAVLHEICYVDNAYDMKHYQKRKDYVAKTLAKGIVS